MPIYEGHERVLLDVARAKNGVTFGNGDTNVYRGAANQLKTDDEVVIANGGGKDTLALTSTSADTGLTLGADTNLYRPSADQLKTDDQLEVANAGGKDTLALSSTSADTGLTIGGDTNLYRLAADLLKTDDKLVAAAGLGVGNSAAATTPGTVTKKIEVFDASGTSLGFVAVYDAIT